MACPSSKLTVPTSFIIHHPSVAEALRISGRRYCSQRCHRRTFQAYRLLIVRRLAPSSIQHGRHRMPLDARGSAAGSTADRESLGGFFPCSSVDRDLNVGWPTQNPGWRAISARRRIPTLSERSDAAGCESPTCSADAGPAQRPLESSTTHLRRRAHGELQQPRYQVHSRPMPRPSAANTAPAATADARARRRDAPPSYRR